MIPSILYGIGHVSIPSASMTLAYSHLLTGASQEHNVLQASQNAKSIKQRIKIEIIDFCISLLERIVDSDNDGG